MAVLLTGRSTQPGRVAADTRSGKNADMPIGCAAAATGGGDYDAMNLKDHIRGVPDFPKPGILFYDISTLLANAGAWLYPVDRPAEPLRPATTDIPAGLESRGFLVASPLALRIATRFLTDRKKAKHT